VQGHPEKVSEMPLLVVAQRGWIAKKNHKATRATILRFKPAIVFRRLIKKARNSFKKALFGVVLGHRLTEVYHL
jgi:hypothetical protein